MAKPVDENRLLSFWNDIKKTLGPMSGGGITVPVNGFFTMAVDEEGNLWAYSADYGTTPPFEYDSDTGDLYVVFDVG